MGFGGVTVKTLPSRAVGPGSIPARHIRDLFLEPIQSVGAEWTLNCVCVPMSGLLLLSHGAAITGEANRLLSLDLSSLGDGSQLPGRAAIINSGQGSTLAHIQTPHTH
jgi:hypothetical protein